MSEYIDTKQLRSFGLTVGGVFLLIGLWPVMWRGEAIRLWAVVPAALLIPAGLIIPRTLQGVFKVWMAIGHALGWINTRIILGILFYGLITPMGFIMRMFGRDPMGKGWVPEVQTYRVIRHRRPPSHMMRQF